MSIERYQIELCGLKACTCGMSPQPEGDYVRYEDFAALAAENAALAEWASDRAICDDALEQQNYTTLKIDWRQRSLDVIKTPATDRFLAEQRAVGVEMAIGHIAQTICPNHETILHEFANKLRNEVKV